MSVQERREREKEHRRAMIVDAAERVFFRKGAAATMEEIAAEAQLAKGTLYLYFPSKDDLHLLLVCNALDILNRFFAKVKAEDAPPDQKVRRIGEEYVAFYKTHPEYYRLLSAPPVQGDVSSEVLALYEQKAEAVWSILTGFLRDGMDAGLFRKDIPPFEMAVILWTMSGGVLRLIDMLSQGTVWNKIQGDYSIRNIDLFKLLETATGMLMQSFETIPESSSRP